MKQTEIIGHIFKQQFEIEPEVICYAPGRVNLLGDHTDYNDGFVLPAAIDVLIPKVLLVALAVLSEV